MSNSFPTLGLSASLSSAARLEVLFELTSGDAAAAAPAITRLVDAFVAPGALGGYVAPGVPAVDSRSEILSVPVLTSGSLAFNLTAENVEPRAFQVLRNMAGRLLIPQVTVGRIAVRDLAGRAQRVELLPADEHNQDRVYPGLSDQVSFSVEWVNTEFSLSRRCEIEFERPWRLPM